MIAGIVLAAGASVRMGRPKALLDVDGRPAVDGIVETLRAAGAAPIVVVLGRHAAETRAGARLDGVAVVDHPGWAAGRTSSLQAGLRALPADASAAVVALVDMPYVRAETVRALVDAFGAAHELETLVPAHDGRRGHPVLLARAVFARVLALGPDEPLHVVTRAANTREVPVDDPGILIDLDTPEDLARPS